MIPNDLLEFEFLLCDAFNCFDQAIQLAEQDEDPQIQKIVSVIKKQILPLRTKVLTEYLDKASDEASEYLASQEVV